MGSYKWGYRGLGFLFKGFLTEWGSYKWGYKSPNIGYNYSYPTYNPAYNYP